MLSSLRGFSYSCQTISVSVGHVHHSILLWLNTVVQPVCLHYSSIHTYLEMIQFSSSPCENKSNKRQMKSEVYTVSRATIEPHLLYETARLGRWSGRCALCLAHTLAWFSIRQDILELRRGSEPNQRSPITRCEFVMCTAQRYDSYESLQQSQVGSRINTPGHCLGDVSVTKNIPLKFQCLNGVGSWSMRVCQSVTQPWAGAS